MLVINPIECIDCGVCEPECPADAIQSDNQPSAKQWVDFNHKYSLLWPNITKKRDNDVPEDSHLWHNVDNKIQYFISTPGRGD